MHYKGMQLNSDQLSILHGLYSQVIHKWGDKLDTNQLVKDEIFILTEAQCNQKNCFKVLLDFWTFVLEEYEETVLIYF